MIRFVLAGSAPEEAAFAHAVERYEEAEFAAAIVELQALERTQDHDLLLRTKLYVAMCYLGLQDRARATAAVDALLDLDPEFNLPPFSSPVVRTFFAAVKDAHVVVPLLAHSAPLEIEALAGVTLALDATRMRAGDVVRLRYRFNTNTSFASMDVAERGKLGRYEVRLPGAFINPDALLMQYFFVVEREGAPVAFVRSEKSPFELPIVAPRPVIAPPAHKQWWFWTAIVGGAAVVAGVVAGVAVYTKNNSPSDATVTVRF